MYPLLTNIDSQFIDDCGKPLAGGKVFTYEANSTTLKTTYADTDGTAINTNPIILDDSGRAKIYLEDGAYRVRVLNKKGALIADTSKISRYVTSTELDEFIQTVQDGVAELSQVKEALGVIVDTALDEQKGVTNGIASLDENTLVPVEYLPSATETAQGVAEIATIAETRAGTDDSRIVTPHKLAQTVFGMKQTTKVKTVVSGTTYTHAGAKPIFLSISMIASSSVSAVVRHNDNTLLDTNSSGRYQVSIFVAQGDTYYIAGNSIVCVEYS